MIAYFIKGGPLLIVIAGLSVVAGTLAILQWLRLMQISSKGNHELHHFIPSIEAQDWDRASEIIERHPHILLMPWKTGFQLLAEGKSDLRDIEELVTLEGARIIADLESPLKPLGAITTVLPMLGFLGTIVGLILSFHHWEQMGSQVSIQELAGGIYQAMITTAAGLATAIPYFLLYHYFTARIQRFSLELSLTTTQIFRLVKNALLREISFEAEPASKTTHDPTTCF